MEALLFSVNSHLPSTSSKIRKFKLKFNRNTLYPLNRRLPIPHRAISNFALIKCSAHSHHHSHDHHHESDHHHHDDSDHNHNHHHHCCHNHGGGDANLTKSQQAFLKFAEAIKWTDLASFLREHLNLCCCATALFLAATASPYLLPTPAVKPLQYAFSAIAFPLVGISASFDAAFDIVGGKINIHVLMALAAFASVFMGNALEGGLLLAMFNLAHIAEDYFTSRSMIDVKELKENHPDFALVLDVQDGIKPSFSDLKYHKVPVNDLETGSYVLVQAGESVPVDCEVSQGSSTVTVEHLTGETKPVEKTVGDSIPGGARNLDGVMIVKAKKTWKESTLNRIVQLTEEAQQSKPKLQRWLDKFGEQYSRAVIILSAAVALLGPVLFKWPFFSTAVCRGSIYRALGLMVAASPCALAVTPLVYATAISSCARKGILLKGGHVLDALASCENIGFDKTGTLTNGEFMCKAIEPILGHVNDHKKQDALCCVPSCEDEALAVAAAMEKGTTHPIGRAVVDHSIGKDLPPVSVESFENLPGRGLFATISSIEPGFGGGKSLKASIGSVEYITSLFKSDDESRVIREAVSTSSYGGDFVRAALSVNNKVTLFHFEDKPRADSSDVIKSLQNDGNLRVMMLTGDHELSAWRVANAVGIKEVHCSLKPEDKLYHVTSISRDTGGGVIMVGDGINDAPALAAATVGIVLAERASATAVAVADVLLLQDNISGVPFCIAKSRQTTALVKQNVALALSSIFLASLTSVLGVVPLWLTGTLVAGTDTSSVTIEWAMSNLVNNPNVLVKAREELDAKVGFERLMNEEDLSNLPYLNSVILETFRLFPAVPLLLPHSSSEDCKLGGYDIQKNTILFVNVWGIHRDPTVWEDASDFKPERFEGVSDVGANKFLMPFGMGRRACPGSSLGKKLVGLGLGSMVQCFEWERVGLEGVDLGEGEGLTMPKFEPLQAMCKPREVMRKVMISSIQEAAKIS